MANVGDAAGEIFNVNSRTLAPAAVGSQVALMSVVSVCFANRSSTLHSLIALRLLPFFYLMYCVPKTRSALSASLRPPAAHPRRNVDHL